MGAATALAAVLGIGFAPQIAVAQPAAEPAIADEEVAAEAALPAYPSAVVPPVPVSPRRARVAVAAPVPVTPGVLPYIAAEPQPPAEPGDAPARRKPRAGAIAGEGQSVEARLDRLERMIEELVARDKDVYGKGGGFPQPGFKYDPKELARMQKELEHSNKEVERAAKEAAKSFADAQKNWNFEGFQNFQFGDFKNPKAHRKALEAQRKALEKQLQVIEQRLDALQDEEEADQDEEGAKIKEKIKDKQNKFSEKEKNDSAPDDKPKR